MTTPRAELVRAVRDADPADLALALVHAPGLKCRTRSLARGRAALTITLPCPIDGARPARRTKRSRSADDPHGLDVGGGE